MTSININRYISTTGDPRTIGTKISSLSLTDLSTTQLSVSQATVTDALTFNQTATIPTGATGATSIYMDSADSAFKAKVNSTTATSFAVQGLASDIVSFTTPMGTVPITIQFLKTGNSVLLAFPNTTGTYASTTKFYGTLPAAYAPVSDLIDYAPIIQAAGSSLGKVIIASDGLMTIGCDSAGSDFSLAGTVTIEPFYISYHV